MVAFMPRHLKAPWFGYSISFCWLSIYFSLSSPPSPALFYYKWSTDEHLVPTYLWACLISSLGNTLEIKWLVQRKSTLDKYIFKACSMFSFYSTPALKVKNCSSNMGVDVASSKKPFLTLKSGGGASLLPAQNPYFLHPAITTHTCDCLALLGSTELPEACIWVCPWFFKMYVK